MTHIETIEQRRTKQGNEETGKCRCPKPFDARRRTNLQWQVSARHLLVDRHARPLDREWRNFGLDLPSNLCLYRLPLCQTEHRHGVLICGSLHSQAVKWIKVFCSWPAASRVLRLAENSVLADMSATISALRSTVSALAPPEESAPNEAIRVAAFSSLTPTRCRPSR